jgi:uncharacterized protein YggE
MTVSDPEAANRSAYAQAYKAARARAETYAAAAGLKISRVLAIATRASRAVPSLIMAGWPPKRHVGSATSVRAADAAGNELQRGPSRADFALAAN